MSRYELFFEEAVNLSKIDSESAHTESEFALYRDKGELAEKTRLGNLFAKKIILEKLGLDFSMYVKEVEVTRVMYQGYGFGMPQVKLTPNLLDLWLKSNAGAPYISLSHDDNQFALVLATENKLSRFGVDILKLSQANTLYESGNYALYITEDERAMLDRIEDSVRKREVFWAGFCIKEALFKAIQSTDLLGANNRMPYMQVWPKKSIEGQWDVKILDSDQPLLLRDKWYPRLIEIFKDNHLDVANIHATFQKIDDQYGFAVVECFYQIDKKYLLH